MPSMNFRLAKPSVLIDINLLTDLAGVHGDQTRCIGAMTRYRTLERDPMIARYLPIIADALPHIAHPQIRNRGTLGGNLAHADPASEMPAIMLALRADMELRSKAGTRTVSASRFFLGALETALRSDEMLIAVHLPVQPPHTGTAFMEVARRRGDFAIAGVAAVVSLDSGGRCSAARLAYCGVADRPIEAPEAMQALVGTDLGDTAVTETAKLSMNAIDPPGNVHASPAYQRHVVGVLTRRALVVARDRARMSLRGS